MVCGLASRYENVATALQPNALGVEERPHALKLQRQASMGLPWDKIGGGFMQAFQDLRAKAM
jgi:hypothetical protein